MLPVLGQQPQRRAILPEKRYARKGEQSGERAVCVRALNGSIYCAQRVERASIRCVRFISFLVLRDGARTMCVGVGAVDPLGLDELTAVCEGACNERVANLPRALAGDALQLCNVQRDIEKMGKGKISQTRRFKVDVTPRLSYHLCCYCCSTPTSSRRQHSRRHRARQGHPRRGP